MKKQWPLMRYIFFLALILFVVYKIDLVSRAVIERAASFAVYPVLRIQEKMVQPVRDFFQKNKTHKEFEQAISRLQNERDSLLADNIRMQATFAHFQDIKEMLEFKEHYENYDARLVHVILRNISDQSHFFLVDKGSASGIKKNMVAVYKNGLIGRVEEVYPLYSKVMLITDRSCKVAASCTKTGTQGIFEGGNKERSAFLNRVSHLSPIESQDLVVSTGQGLIFPQGFGLGHIKTFQRDLITYTIEIEPLFDFHSLNYCYLLANKD